jgi:hypothetical protein
VTGCGGTAPGDRLPVPEGPDGRASRPTSRTADPGCGNRAIPPNRAPPRTARLRH